MNVYEHYYKKVVNEKLNKEQLIKIIKQISNLNRVVNNRTMDLYIKISESPEADDEVVRLLVRQCAGSIFIKGEIHKILDNGSKKLFDDIWNEVEENYKNSQPKYYYEMQYWLCKHADEKQLTKIYNSIISVEKKSGQEKWTNSQKIKFFQHPNAPDKILSMVKHINNDLDGTWAAIQMASNPNITKKSKVFKIICEKIKNFKGFDKNITDIIEKLLSNKTVDWDLVATEFELEKQVEKIFDDNFIIPQSTKNVIINFCKNDSCPEKIKQFLYAKTQDESFLPVVARKIFLF